MGISFHEELFEKFEFNNTILIKKLLDLDSNQEPSG
jgi:hypothetical protein